MQRNLTWFIVALQDLLPKVARQVWSALERLADGWDALPSSTRQDMKQGILDAFTKHLGPELTPLFFTIAVACIGGFREFTAKEASKP